MPVLPFGSVGFSGLQAGGAYLEFDIVAGGEDRFLLIKLAYLEATISDGVYIESVTCNGALCTADTTWNNLTFWTFLSPVAGTNTIRVTVGGDPLGILIVTGGCEAWQGVRQFQPIENGQVDNQISAVASVNFEFLAGYSKLENFVSSAVSWGETSGAVGTGTPTNRGSQSMDIMRQSWPSIFAVGEDLAKRRRMRRARVLSGGYSFSTSGTVFNEGTGYGGVRLFCIGSILQSRPPETSAFTLIDYTLSGSREWNVLAVEIMAAEGFTSEYIPAAVVASRRQTRRGSRVWKFQRGVQVFEPEAPYDVEGSADPVVGTLALAVRRKGVRDRSRMWAFTRGAQDFEADAPYDIDGNLDPSSGLAVAMRRLAQRGRRGVRALARSWQFEEAAPYDVDGNFDPTAGSIVLSVRRSGQRGRRVAWALRRSTQFEPESPFDFDGAGDPVSELPYAIRRRLIRSRAPAWAFLRAMQSDPDSPYDVEGSADPIAGELVFAVRRLSLRGRRPAWALQRSAQFEPEAPIDEDGNADPVAGEIVFAIRRRAYRGRPAAWTLLRGLQVEPEAPFDEEGSAGDVVFLRRRALRGRPSAWALRRSHEPESPFDVEGSSDPIAGELVFATRRRMYRNRPGVEALARAWQFETDAPFDEEGSADPIAGELVFAARRRLYRNRPSGLSLARAWEFDPEAPFNEDGSADVVAGELVFAVRRLAQRGMRSAWTLQRSPQSEFEQEEEGGGGPDALVFMVRRKVRRPTFTRAAAFDVEVVDVGEPVGHFFSHAPRRPDIRGFRFRASLYRQGFDPVAPQAPVAEVFRRPVREYVKKTYFVHTGRKIGRRTRR